MLQKLEDFYLAILRFVVIFVAGALLVAVAWFATRSFDVVNPAPEPVEATPVVSQAAIKKSVLGSVVETSAGSTTPAGSVGDPNQAYYNRIAASIKNFFDAHFPGEYNIELGRLAEIVKSRAEIYDATGMTTVFAKNVSENIDGLLTDKDFLAFAQREGAGEALDRVLTAFSEEFDRQVAATEAENQARRDAFLDEKAQSLQSLYFAAVAFGIFLLIVFLSIIIRIERNLRPQSAVQP